MSWFVQTHKLKACLIVKKSFFGDLIVYNLKDQPKNNNFISLPTYISSCHTAADIISLIPNIQTVDITDYMYKTNAMNNAYAALAIKIVMLILYGYVLQVLCDNKLERVAWIILLFPFLVIGFLVLYSTSVGLISSIRGKNEE